MTVSAIKKLSRKVGYTATWAAGVMTVTTATPHYLKTGDTVFFVAEIVTFEFGPKVVTVTGASAFTVPVADYPYATSRGNVIMYYYSTGQTGDQDVFTITNSSINVIPIIQFTAHGAGGASLAIYVSNDLAGWVQVGTITLASADLATEYFTFSTNWNYAKLSITSIGAATSVVVSVAS